MPPFRRTEPAAGSNLVSALMRDNFQALEDQMAGATARAQTTADLTVKIEAFIYLGADGTTRKSFAGGNSPTIVAPSANPRIALLTIDDAASLAWTYGIEAATPAAPNYPRNKVPICEVFERVAQTSIQNTDDATNAYLLRQASHIHPAGRGSGAGVPGVDFFEFGEIADPATPAADLLRFYAKDDGAGRTRAAVKDAAALVHMLLGGTGVRELEIIRKTADETVNNSTVLQNDDHLVVAVAANAILLVLAVIVQNSSAVADFKCAFTAPAGATGGWGAPNAAVAIGASLKGADFFAFGTAGTYQGNAVDLVQLFAVLCVNGSTAGNLQFQFAQSTAEVSETIVRNRSVLAAWRI